MIENFKKIFGETSEIRTFHAPGRVNIIGEHIDYNGGNVLPFSLRAGTHALIAERRGKTARFASENFPGVVEISLENIVYDTAHDWANYPKGIVHSMQREGREMGGFDILFSGNIPNGAGLSSSASVEMATAVALNAVFSLNYAPADLVKLAQKSENNFCGVNCGIMDQFAVGLGKKNFAVLLNCETLKFNYVQLALGDFCFVIMDTKKRRRLNESKYNERRAECDRARAILGEFTVENFRATEISDEIIRKRARHVIYENKRVASAVDALEKGDIAALGELLNQSHASLRDDYEVSCRELDTIVAEAVKLPACLGARMTGAGFGGCAIAIVARAAVPLFIKTVSANYEKIIGHAPEIYICESGDGAREISDQRSNR